MISSQRNMALTTLLVCGAPSLALAAPQTYQELVGLFVLIINVATPTLVAAGLLFFLLNVLGVMGFNEKNKDGKRERSFGRIKQVAPLAVFILFVMVSVWGILRLLENTFLRGDLGGVEAGGEAELCDELDC
ncbi:MAG: hypothetical protein AAB421_02515 [Patescibacteria group bacterium]